MRAISKRDFEIIGARATRAISAARAAGVEYDRTSALMDIESAHRDTPLKLLDLLGADDFNFAHDVFGIRSHLDRTNFPGKLTDFFRPRYAK